MGNFLPSAIYNFNGTLSSDHYINFITALYGFSCNCSYIEDMVKYPMMSLISGGFGALIYGGLCKWIINNCTDDNLTGIASAFLTGATAYNIYNIFVKRNNRSKKYILKKYNIMDNHIKIDAYYDPRSPMDNDEDLIIDN